MRKKIKRELSKLIIVALLLFSIDITAFAGITGNESSNEENRATPSEATYQLLAPYDVSLNNNFNLSFSCDEDEYDHMYSAEIKIRSTSKTHTFSISVDSVPEDISDTVTGYIDSSDFAGLECYISCRVKAVPKRAEEALESGYSDWSEEIFYETERAVLNTPEHLRWNGETAEWDSVEHASQYYVNFIISNEQGVHEDFSAYPYQNSVNMRSLFESACRERGLTKGTYSVKFRVKALGGNTGASAAYTASAYSEYSDAISAEYGITVQQLATPDNVVLTENLDASWSAVENAYEYAVSIDTSDANGTVFNTGMLITQNISANLVQSVEEICNQQGRTPEEILVRIRVQARCRFDSVNYTSSEYSPSTEYVSYSYETVVEKLETPAAPVWGDGYLISWNAVDHAYEYQVNFRLGDDASWMLTTKSSSADLESSIKEAAAFKILSAGEYEIKARVKAVALWSDTAHTHSDYSGWSEAATFIIAGDSGNSGESSDDAGGESESQEEGTRKPTSIVHPSNGSSSDSGTSSDVASTVAAQNLPEYVETTGTWKESSGTWSYSNNGVEYKDKWAAICFGNTYGWFFFDANGTMLTGWFTDKDGSVYYLNPVSDGTKGKMVTGKVVIDGVEYIFGEDGRLVK